MRLWPTSKATACLTIECLPLHVLLFIFPPQRFKKHRRREIGKNVRASHWERAL